MKIADIRALTRLVCPAAICYRHAHCQSSLTRKTNGHKVSKNPLTLYNTYITKLITVQFTHSECNLLLTIVFIRNLCYYLTLMKTAFVIKFKNIFVLYNHVPETSILVIHDDNHDLMEKDKIHLERKKNLAYCWPMPGTRTTGHLHHDGRILDT